MADLSKRLDMTLAGVSYAVKKGINRRTLQRRLGRLLADKRITTEGESIALVYKSVPRVITAKATAMVKLSDHTEAEIYIPVRRREASSAISCGNR